MAVFTLEDRIMDPGGFPYGYYGAKDLPFTFTTGGDLPWVQQDSVFNTAAPAWQSGAITDNQESWLQLCAFGGAGTFSFYWKVSSEEDWDFLYVVIDGKEYSISGEVDWTLFSVELPDGLHDVKWRYVKDVSYGEGSDLGWVDDIVFERS